MEPHGVLVFTRDTQGGSFLATLGYGMPSPPGIFLEEICPTPSRLQTARPV